MKVIRKLSEGPATERFAYHSNEGFQGTFTMMAMTLAFFLMTARDLVPHAYTVGDNQICVDPPAGMVDWEALARKELGNARVDHPSIAFLRKHTDEYGYGTSLELKVAPTAAVTGRLWNILHERGVYRLLPESLRVVVIYDVDKDLTLRGPTAFEGQLCGRGKPSVLAAFVLPQDFRLLGEAKWGVDVIPRVEHRDQATYLFFWRDHRYKWRSIYHGKIKRASVFLREDGERFILIRWLEGGCESDFSLLEVSGKKLVQVGDNDYDCDL
jgi:hypothetical protein